MSPEPRLDAHPGWGRVPVDPRVPDRGDAVRRRPHPPADCTLATPAPAIFTRFATSAASSSGSGTIAPLPAPTSRERNVLDPTSRRQSLFQMNRLRLCARSSRPPCTPSSRFASGGFSSTQACLAAAS